MAKGNNSRLGSADARGTVHGTAAHRGDLQFRAGLYGLTSRHDHHPLGLHPSDVVTLHVG